MEYFSNSAQLSSGVGGGALVYIIAMDQDRGGSIEEAKV